MRYPETKFIKRVFHLFSKLGIEKGGLLQPFIFSVPEHNILYFNGRCMTAQAYAQTTEENPLDIGLRDKKDELKKTSTRVGTN